MRRAVPLLFAFTALALAACNPFATPSPTATQTLAPSATPQPTQTRTPTPSPTPTVKPTSTPTPTPTPTSTPTLLPTRAPQPAATPRVWEALWPESPPRPFQYEAVQGTGPRLVPNALRRFWVTDTATMERREVTARLRVQTEHTQLWVEEGSWYDIRRLQRAALVFETQIYPRVRAALGSEWVPGVDNDPHILILHAAGLGEGVAGYTTGIDEFPRTEEPFSNEAELIVVSNALDVGGQAYYALLARQFANIIHWPQDRNESQWLRQGLADLAVRLSGIQSDGAIRTYLSDTDVSLAAEGHGVSDPGRRGGAALLTAYIHERFQDEGTQMLVAEPLNGFAGIEATLAHLGSRLSVEDLLADWLAANYLDHEPSALPLHGYDGLQLERPVPAATIEGAPARLESTVHQLGVDYILVRGEGDLEVSFAGVTQTLLLDLRPRAGDYFWWSNRADESRATLSRSFDLSGVDQATLSYWAWYDIEPGFDYAFIEVSPDGGSSWVNVPASNATGDALDARSPDWAYTGSSGAPPGWVYETVDLSPYAGEENVAVRFVYLTDGAVTGPGFAVDEIQVTEIGYVSGAELNEVDWEAEGFLRTDGFVPQRYLAVLIGLGDRITVDRLPIEEDQTATWLVSLGSKGWREAILALSGLAPMTGQPARYSLEVEQIAAGD